MASFIEFIIGANISFNSFFCSCDLD